MLRNSIPERSCRFCAGRWCGQNYDVINMAATVTIYQCSDCKRCFQSLQSIRNHPCCSTTPDNTMKVVTNDENYDKNAQNDNRKTMFQCEGCKAWFADCNVYAEHICIPSEDTDSSPPASNEECAEEDAMWTRPPTLFLIEQYAMKKDMLDRGRMKKRDFWKHVSDELKKKEYRFTPEQVNGRWKTLVKNYKAMKDENKKSGSGKKEFPYLDMLDDIFYQDHAVNPKKTVSTSTGASSKRSAPSDPDDVDLKESCKKKRQTQSQEVIEFLGKYMETQNKRNETEMAERKKEHEEKMDILKAIVQSLNK